MTEEIPENLVSQIPRSLMEFKGYASTMPSLHKYYKDPTPAEIRQLIKLMGWKGAQVASLTGTGPRTVRRWQSPPNLPGYRKIPYSSWRLLLGYAGVVQLTESESKKLLAEKQNKLEGE